MAKQTKSIRLRDELIDEIGNREGDFSKYVTHLIEADIDDNIWLPNLLIHDYAKIDSTTLLNRVKNVKYLRCSANTLAFHFYPVSKQCLKENKALFEYVRGNSNLVHDRFTYFNINFPIRLYKFLRLRSWKYVQETIINSLAMLYWIEPDKRPIIESQLERAILNSVLNVYKKEFGQLSNVYAEAQAATFDSLELNYSLSEACLTVMEKLRIDPDVLPYGGILETHLLHPRTRYRDYSGSEKFDVFVKSAYMRNVYDKNDDWNKIVLTDEEYSDDLGRTESESWPFAKWKMNFKEFHKVET
ncbi:MAG: hypothetical protein Salg2KO_00010 [Salibacteraceae bacterium]